MVNYLLSAKFTFRKKKSVKNGFGFGGAHLFNYFLQIGLLNLFLWLGVSKELAPVPVYCIAIPTKLFDCPFCIQENRLMFACWTEYGLQLSYKDIW